VSSTAKQVLATLFFELMIEKLEIRLASRAHTLPGMTGA
jgi:hypothetical protein